MSNSSIPEIEHSHTIEQDELSEHIESPENNLEAFKNGAIISKEIWGTYIPEEVQEIIRDVLSENQDASVNITGGTVYRMIGAGNPGSDIDILTNNEIIEQIRNKTNVVREGAALQVVTHSGNDLDLLNSRYFSKIGIEAIKRYFPFETKIELLKRKEKGEILERDLFQLFPWETMQLQFGLDDEGELEATFIDAYEYMQQAKKVDGKILFPSFHENGLYANMLSQFDQAITYSNTIRFPEPRVAIWAMSSGIRLASTACVQDIEIISSISGDERLAVFNDVEVDPRNSDINQKYLGISARVIKHLGQNKPLFYSDEISTHEVNEIMQQQTQKQFAKAALNDPVRAYEYFFQVFEAGDMIAPQIQRNFDAFHENYVGINNNILYLIEHAHERGEYVEHNLVPELLKDEGVQSLLNFKKLCQERFGEEKATAKHPSSMSEILALMYVANGIPADEIETIDHNEWYLKGKMEPSNPRYSNVEFDTEINFDEIRRIVSEFA